MTQPAEIIPPALTAAQVASYQRDGFLVVPKAVAYAGDRLSLERKTQSVLDGRRQVRRTFGRARRMSDNLDPFTLAQIQTPETVAVLQQLIGPHIEFLSMKAVFKNAKTNFHSPWHQDWHDRQGAAEAFGLDCADDATPENGCLRLAPGSHRVVIEMQTVEDGKGFNLRITDEQVAGLPIETVPVKRGDAIFFHDLTLHGLCPNVNGQERCLLLPPTVTPASRTVRPSGAQPLS